MSQIAKKFIQANAVDETKMLINNNAWVRALDSSAAPANVWKLNASNVIEFASLPTTSAGAPSNPQDLVTKQYADSLIQGLAWKNPVQAASNLTNVALSGSTPLVVDGYTVVNGDRILLKDQTLTSQNGVYTVSISGGSYATTRSVDMNTGSEFPNATVAVENGSVNQDGIWTCTNNTNPTVGTDPVTFAKVTTINDLVAGTGLTKVGLTLNVNADAATNTTLFNGSNQIAVKLDAAGAVVTGAGGLKVQLEASNPSLQIASNRLGLKIDPARALTSTASGVGVVVDGNGIQIVADAVAAKLDSNGALIASGTGGTQGLAVQLESSNPTMQITGNRLGVRYAPTGAGLTQDGTGLKVSVDTTTDATTRIDTSGRLVTPVQKIYNYTLTSTDISNQYIDLPNVAQNNSVGLFVIGSPMQVPGTDFTVSQTGGSGGNTRVSFSSSGDIYSSGAAALVSGDKVCVTYRA